MWLSSCRSRLHTGAAKATQMKQPLSLKKCAKTRTWSPKQSAINANVVAREKNNSKTRKDGSQAATRHCLHVCSCLLFWCLPVDSTPPGSKSSNHLFWLFVASRKCLMGWLDALSAQPGNSLAVALNARQTDVLPPVGQYVSLIFFISFIEFHMRS